MACFGCCRCSLLEDLQREVGEVSVLGGRQSIRMMATLTYDDGGRYGLAPFAIIAVGNPDAFLILRIFVSSFIL